MVLDSSALIANLGGEPESLPFIELIEAADSLLISAATHQETSIVIESRYGAEGIRDLDLLLTTTNVSVIPFDGDLALVARRAFSRFGKGRHNAALDSADCFSFALAMTRAEPLLFKGNDFSEKDVSSADHGS